MSTSFGAIHDPAATTRVVALTAQSGVAAGTGDNTEKTSAAIDRKPQGTPGFDAIQIELTYITTVTAGQTLKLTLKIEESADGSSWGTAETLLNAVTLETGAVTAKTAVYEHSLDLRKRKRYIRFLVTLDLSAGSADTFVYAATGILSAADAFPA